MGTLISPWVEGLTPYGVDLAIQIKAECPECRVLLFSGQASTQDLLQDARRQGHDFQLLLKPVHPTVLLKSVEALTLESITLLASASRAFVEFCAAEMEANPEACEASVEKSLSMVTSLNPLIGYERAAALAKEAFKSGKTIRQLCEEQRVLPADTLRKALDPWSMTEPHG